MKRYACTFALLFAGGCDAAPTPRQAAVSGPVETRGLDSAILADTVAQAHRLPRLRSLLILRDGQVLAEHRFNGGPPLDRPVNIKSASKSVLSALVGIAIAKGVLTGVDQPVLSILRSDAPLNPDPRLTRLTVEDLLTMRAGLERTSGENYGLWVSSREWVRFALARPFVHEPGGAMLYSTGNTHLLSAMLTRASGRDRHGNALEVVRLPEARRGSVLLPRRWVVERSFAWAPASAASSKIMNAMPKHSPDFMSSPSHAS